MKKIFSTRFFVAMGWAMLVLALAAGTGCEKQRGGGGSGDRKTASDEVAETVLAVSVDHGTATSEGNAHRVLLSKSGEAAAGWSRDPSSMRRLDRLTAEKKAIAIQAARDAVTGVKPGEFAFGSKPGDWLRVVVITNKRRVVYDEAAGRGAPTPAALRSIIDALLDPADR